MWALTVLLIIAVIAYIVECGCNRDLRWKYEVKCRAMQTLQSLHNQVIDRYEAKAVEFNSRIAEIGKRVDDLESSTKENWQ